MVNEAIWSFKPFQAAGQDMVFLALLQKEVGLISFNLAGIFKACLNVPLTNEGFEPICYADDVIILLRGKNPNLLCRRAESTLILAYNMVRPRGFNVYLRYIYSLGKEN